MGPSPPLAPLGAADFYGSTLRTVMIKGEPWFVAADVRRFVAPNGSTHYLIKELAGDQKGVQTLHTLGGPQRLSIISESGLYKLTMRSDKPAAKAFQDWLTMRGVKKVSLPLAGHRDCSSSPKAGSTSSPCAWTSPLRKPSKTG